MATRSTNPKSELITLRRPLARGGFPRASQPHQTAAVFPTRSALRVALVSMPFASRTFPSIQIGLLAAIGRARGFTVTPLHLNLDFVKVVGAKVYSALGSHRGCVSKEWLFAKEAFGEDPHHDDQAFFDACGARIAYSLEQAKLDHAGYLALRDEAVPPYLDALMANTAWGEFDVVGFTCSFEQSVASLALARRIKRAHPNVITLFGGANFDGDMGPELVRTIHTIDYAIVGEADEAFPEFLEAIYEQRDPANVAGVICRDEEGRVNPPPERAPFTNLDSLPTPIYEDYFERSERLRLSSREARGDVFIPFESARGCWWGEKHHCTFCGLNNQTMSFRAKSPERVRDELADLARETESFRFQAVDNILDSSYLTSFVPELTRAQVDYSIFYEVKSNLTRAQIKTLADAGIRDLQPGIESLNSHVLSLMRKGVKAIQQVNMLRWAQYYGVHVGWNMLWGFPGETKADYDAQIALISRVRHLRPPGGQNRIWMERFSPLYFDETVRKKYIRPQESYGYVYPSTVDLEKIAYFFDYELEETLPDAAYQEIDEVVTQWRNTWEKSLRRPTFFYWSSPNLVRLEDRRDPANPRTVILRGVEAAVYCACTDLPRTAEAARKALVAAAQVKDTDKMDTDVVRRALESLDERTLMMREDDKFLSLAIPAVSGR